MFNTNLIRTVDNRRLPTVLWCDAEHAYARIAGPETDVPRRHPRRFSGLILFAQFSADALIDVVPFDLSGLLLARSVRRSLLWRFHLLHEVSEEK